MDDSSDSLPPVVLPPPPGPRYILHISFRSANQLPIGDLPTRSSDPYIVATLRFPATSFPKLHNRTQTRHSTLNPVWNETWSIANVPVHGIFLKLKVMDEDLNNHDDKLGVAHILTGPLDRCETNMLFLEKLKPGKGVWEGTKRMLMSTCTGGGRKGEVEIGISLEEMTRKTGTGKEYDYGEAGDLMRAYTIGPNWYSRHSSPLIGIITNTKNLAQDDQDSEEPGQVRRFAFMATKIQLTGPVPEVLRHRYVAFRPIIKTFYTKSGLLGIALNRALHRQYRIVYSYDKATTYGLSHSDDELARRVLEFTSWGEGGRLFTYIITLDGEWRFTETGKEFGIQMLSKHTMHSCVQPYVAFAGEFFVRNISSQDESSSSHRPPELHHHDSGVGGHRLFGRPRHNSRSSTNSHMRNIEDYELVIDNDSGTYRPPKEHIPDFEKFLHRALPCLRVRVRDAFDEEHMEMKKNHVEVKERSGRRLFKQPSFSSSDEDGHISSSDEEELQTGHVGKGSRFKKKVWGKLENKVEGCSNRP